MARAGTGGGRYYGFLRQYASCIEAHFTAAPLTTQLFVTPANTTSTIFRVADNAGGPGVVDVGLVVGLAVGFVVLAGIVAIVLVVTKKTTARSAAYNTSSVRNLKVVTHLQNIDKA